VQENPVPPRRVDQSLPETLEAITLKCLAKNPANRYPSAQDLRADLGRYLNGSRIMAEPVLAQPGDLAATGLMAPTGYDQTALVAGPVGYEQRNGYDDGYDDFDDLEDEQPKRSKWFLVAMVVLLLILAGLLFLLASNFNNDDEPEADLVDVPLVEGQPLEQAQATLEAEGFEVEVEQEASPDITANQVIRQDPRPPDQAEAGSTVTLTVSTGPEPVLVPDVRNMTQTEASQALSALGLIPNAVPTESDEVEENLVISQEPPGGTEAAPGTQVTINVSSGSGTSTVPQVAGMTEADARAALQGAGFSNITTSQEASQDVPVGNVVRSDPAQGAEVPANQTITLFVSSGPQSVTVPGVEGLSEENATSQLENAGLQVRVTDEQRPDPTQDGTVVSQSPARGSQARAGDTVTIVVARFREPEVTTTVPPGGDR
jgi:beta-lactam-binding protein with PASTA domain